MSWKLSKGTEHLQTLQEAPWHISIRSLIPPITNTTLKQVDPNKGIRYLGVRISLSGTDKDEYNFRLNKAKKLSGKIHLTPLTRQEAHTVYQERWQALLEYVDLSTISPTHVHSKYMFTYLL